jgi:hypothetical protein
MKPEKGEFMFGYLYEGSSYGYGTRASPTASVVLDGMHVEQLA